MASDTYYWLHDYGIPELWDQGLTGAGVKLVVLDTGIEKGHPGLGEVDPARCFNPSRSNDPINVRDYSGHGTHVSGLIIGDLADPELQGIARGVEFYFVKVRGADGDKVEYTTAGLAWARERGVDIVSISIGDDEGSEGLRAEVERCVDQGMLIVAAAGNTSSALSDGLTYPARYDRTLSVGAVDASKVPLESSIEIGNTDLFAPGEEILSTWRRGETRVQSGSSFAAPIVAGVAALTLESKRRTIPDFRGYPLKEIMINNAEEVNGVPVLDTSLEFI